jgi:hypothetical protein
MRNDPRDELDKLIDGVLPGYSSAEPLDGLEERVLRRVHAAGAARRSPWLRRCGFAIPALAALVVAGIVVRTSWKPVPRTASTTPGRIAQSVAAFKPPSPAVAQEFSAPAPQVVRPKFRARTGQEPRVPSRALPKLQYFPTPEPLTKEERALVAWVAQNPAEAKDVFTDLRKRIEEPVTIQPIEMPKLTEEPVKIQPIQIQPLQSDGNQ